jgi:hypothetical protein
VVSIPDLSRARWRTSSHSSGNGECVQVTTTPGGIIAVRDSKNPGGPALAITARTWTRFVRAIQCASVWAR